MKTKSIVVTTLLIALGSVSAMAQQHKKHDTADERATRNTKKMERDLDLKPDQVTKVNELNLERAKAIDSLRNERKGARKAMEDKRIALDSRYKAVLTAEQYAKYEQATESRRKKIMARREHKKG